MDIMKLHQRLSMVAFIIAADESAEYRVEWVDLDPDNPTDLRMCALDEGTGEEYLMQYSTVKAEGYRFLVLAPFDPEGDEPAPLELEG